MIGKRKWLGTKSKKKIDRQNGKKMFRGKIEKNNEKKIFRGKIEKKMMGQKIIGQGQNLKKMRKKIIRGLGFQL